MFLLLIAFQFHGQSAWSGLRHPCSTHLGSSKSDQTTTGELPSAARAGSRARRRGSTLHPSRLAGACWSASSTALAASSSASFQSSSAELAIARFLEGLRSLHIRGWRDLGRLCCMGFGVKNGSNESIRSSYTSLLHAGTASIGCILLL